MQIQTVQRTAVSLLLGLVLAACVANSEPAATLSGQEIDPPTTQAVAPTPLPEPPTPTPAVSAPLPAVALPDLGPAPDFSSEIWLNTDRPLNLAALEGKVVLVEFWTYG